MLGNVAGIFKQLLPLRQIVVPARRDREPIQQPLTAFGLNDFLSLEIPPREMLLTPILPERSLAMLYAPRGIGKSWLSLSIGLAVASGQSFLRWSAPRQRNVLYVDGEMPLVSLQERLRMISPG